MSLRRVAESCMTESPIVEVGQAVFTGAGDKLGTITGYDQRGFRVEYEAGVSGAAGSGVSASGEVELVWRCAVCGEVGEKEDIPAACPSCEAAREDLYYWIED